MKGPQPSKHTQSPSAGQAALRRVLLAHARRSPLLGYTQTMNFLAAFLLLVGGFVLIKFLA